MKTISVLAPLIFIVALLLTLLLTAVRGYREKANALATLAPGPYVRKSMMNNPFIHEYNFVTVLEVMDGWVKFHYTLDTSRDMPHHSDTAENFVNTYTHYYKE